MNDRDKETKRLASTRLGLGNAVKNVRSEVDEKVVTRNLDECLHIHAAQGFVNGPGLYVCHSGKAHLVGDSLHYVGVYKAFCC